MGEIALTNKHRGIKGFYHLGMFSRDLFEVDSTNFDKGTEKNRWKYSEAKNGRQTLRPAFSIEFMVHPA